MLDPEKAQGQKEEEVVDELIGQLKEAYNILSMAELSLNQVLEINKAYCFLICSQSYNDTLVMTILSTLMQSYLTRMGTQERSDDLIFIKTFCDNILRVYMTGQDMIKKLRKEIEEKNESK